MKSAAHPGSLAHRLWIYQAERFPVAKHGAAIAAFAFAGAALPSLFRAPVAGLPGSGYIVATFLAIIELFNDALSYLVAFAVTLVFFVQLRVADEHKDLDADRRFRPERPVPRGLVQLKELRFVAFGAAIVQAILAYVLDPALLLPLALTWTWMALMTMEFFAPQALNARPILYLFSHMAIMPLIAWFAVACGLTNGEEPRSDFVFALAQFLALAFANGLALEIARKSWAPECEREGVESYSRLWGPRAAAAAIVVAIVSALASICTIFFLADLSIWFSAAAAAPAALGAGAAFAYGARPTPRRAETLEGAAGLWALASAALLVSAAIHKGFVV